MPSTISRRDSFEPVSHGSASAVNTVANAMQVAPTEQGDCRAALDALGYDYAEETGNPAYQMFLHNND